MLRRWISGYYYRFVLIIALAPIGCSSQNTERKSLEHATLSPKPQEIYAESLRLPGECEEAVGQMLLTKLPAGSRGKLARYRDRMARMNIGGVVLFKHNIKFLSSRREVADYIEFLKRGHRTPLFVAIDHEGGLVQRLREKQGFTRIPSFATLGNSGNLDRVAAAGARMGQELASVGININFAPVVDLNAPGNPVIRDLRRSASTDPEKVSDMAQLIVQGLQKEGVIAVAKHYPGIGSIAQDPHYSDSYLHLNLNSLMRRDLLPFTKLIDAGVGAIMTSHVKVTRSGDPKKPVSLSRFWIKGLLRQHLNFSGLIVTDDLSMGSIRNHLPIEKASIEAVYAGNDLLLVRQGKELPVVASVCARARLHDAKAKILRREIWDSKERISTVKSLFPMKSVNLSLND